MADAQEHDPEHYFTAQPRTHSAPQQVQLVLPDVRFSLGTDRGVFSASRVDAGTKLLLLEDPLAPSLGGQTAPSGEMGRPPAAQPVPTTLVDLGCGYGPIALTLATRHPGATVWAVDVNERALALCRANADALGLANVVVSRPADVPPGMTVSAVYSNPPIRVGKETLHELLVQWAVRLEPGGPLLLVVGRQLGADSLQRWLEAQGWPTSRIAARAGYRVLRSVPTAPVPTAPVPPATTAPATTAPGPTTSVPTAREQS